MAYADFEFYTETWKGDALSEAAAERYLERASEQLDALTFRRLERAFPEDEADALRVRKAVCAMAEALFSIDRAMSAGVDANVTGGFGGAIKSVSSGRESITFASPAESSVYGRAAADAGEKARLLASIACTYLMDVTDSEGTCLLYAGVDRHV